MSRILGTEAVVDQLRRINGLGKSCRWKLQPLLSPSTSSTTNSTTKTNGPHCLAAHYQLNTFKSTWKFLNDVATTAHQHRHHPTIETTYNRIDIKLTTHDVGNNVTESDTKLARAIEELYTTKYEARP